MEPFYALFEAPYIQKLRNFLAPANTGITQQRPGLLCHIA